MGEKFGKEEKNEENKEKMRKRQTNEENKEKMMTIGRKNEEIWENFCSSN